MTYLVLNVIFMSVVFVGIFVLSRFYKSQKPQIKALVGMLILTLVFDSVLVGSGIVAYDNEKILGIKLGLAPIEDFAYTIVAWALVPFVWSLFNKKGEK